MKYYFYYFKLVIGVKQTRHKLIDYIRSNKFNSYFKIIQFFALNSKSLIQVASNIENQEKFTIGNKNQSYSSLISPSAITCFAKKQLGSDSNYVFSSFTQNIAIKILTYIDTVLAEFKTDILGLKLVIAGK